MQEGNINQPYWSVMILIFLVKLVNDGVSLLIISTKSGEKFETVA